MKVDKNTGKGKIYKICLYMILTTSVFTLAFLWVWDIWNRVPASIYVRAGEEQGLHFYVPATASIYKEKEEGQVNVDLKKAVTFYGQAEDTYTMKVALFGFIPFKETAVSVIQETTLTPLGCPVGIYVQTDGVLVIDTGEFQSHRGRNIAPAKGILQPGDYILKINGEELENKAQLMDSIAQSQGTELLLEIKREGKCMNVGITPVKNQQDEYKLGIWVRDNAQGIGTLTFIDENGYFGALGHGINDLDTANLMQLKTGGLYKTDIISITKGTVGDPGELTGIIAYAPKNKMGDIVQNTSRGIYGVVEESNLQINQEPIPIALKQEIQEGPAQILCTLSIEAEYYDVEIIAIHESNDNINRGLELKVTDEELLEKTGGIIQGMSGSPIVQNGKLVGAVTHVLVNDPTRGYGIFIENMLDVAG